MTVVTTDLGCGSGKLAGGRIVHLWGWKRCREEGLGRSRLVGRGRGMGQLVAPFVATDTMRPETKGPRSHPWYLKVSPAGIKPRPSPPSEVELQCKLYFSLIVLPIAS